MSIFKSILSKIFPSSPTSSAAPTAATAAAPAPTQRVDINAVLTTMANKKTEKLNWRTSIVDLLKVLDLDSGLAARKELAQDLHYSGNTNDSAAMNIWLHSQVMKKLEENGGIVPPELKASA